MQNNSAKFKSSIKSRAYLFALGIIRFIDSLDKKDSSTGILTKQLLRSSTSIGANIIEAQAGSTRKDFTNFLCYALKSSNETKFWLGLLRDAGKADRGRVNQLLQETKELANILGASILKLKGKRE